MSSTALYCELAILLHISLPIGDVAAYCSHWSACPPQTRGDFPKRAIQIDITVISAWLNSIFLVKAFPNPILDDASILVPKDFELLPRTQQSNMVSPLPQAQILLLSDLSPGAMIVSQSRSQDSDINLSRQQALKKKTTTPGGLKTQAKA